jgi:glutaredoxin 2
VKLYMFEHCSLCFRVRMTAALKRKNLQEVVVLDDDTDTMVAQVGKRQVPFWSRTTAGRCSKAWTWSGISISSANRC